MSRLVAAVTSVGDRADAVTARLRTVLSSRRSRRVAVVAGAVALVLYLLAVGDLVPGSGGRSAPGVAGFSPEHLFRTRAPYLFEPVTALAVPPVFTLLLSPVNVVLGALVGTLVGLNLAVATHDPRACRRPGAYGRLVGLLPALLTGMACCVPTFLLAAGSGTAAVLLPVALPLREVFYPLSVALLLGTLAWSLR